MPAYSHACLVVPAYSWVTGTPAGVTDTRHSRPVLTAKH